MPTIYLLFFLVFYVSTMVSVDLTSFSVPPSFSMNTLLSAFKVYIAKLSRTGSQFHVIILAWNFLSIVFAIDYTSQMW